MPINSESWQGLPPELELVGTRERLTLAELDCIAQLVDEQLQRTAVTTLRSMLESEPMQDALQRFDHDGYGNLSYDGGSIIDWNLAMDESLTVLGVE